MTNRTTNTTPLHYVPARASLASRVRAAVSDMSYANRRLFEIQTGPIDKR